MKRSIPTIFVLLLTGLLWLTLAAPAHATLPQECLYHARQELPKEDPNLVGIRFNPLDTPVVQDDPLEEKFEGYVGRQFVSTILSGTGSLQYKNGSEVPVVFICLLNNDKAMFVHTIPIARTVFHAAAPQGKSAYSVLYMCDSKQTVSVRYPGSDESPPSIKIMFWNRVESMVPAVADTGARYVNAYRQWWVKGKVGTLSAVRTNKPVLANCHAL